MEGGAAEYLNQAAAELKEAMQREKEGEFSAAIRSYRAAVDILITGVQGESSRAGCTDLCVESCFVCAANLSKERMAPLFCPTY